MGTRQNTENVRAMLDRAKELRIVPNWEMSFERIMAKGWTVTVLGNLWVVYDKGEFFPKLIFPPFTASGTETWGPIYPPFCRVETDFMGWTAPMTLFDTHILDFHDYEFIFKPKPHKPDIPGFVEFHIIDAFGNVIDGSTGPQFFGPELEAFRKSPDVEPFAGVRIYPENSFHYLQCALVGYTSAGDSEVLAVFVYGENWMFINLYAILTKVKNANFIAEMAKAFFAWIYEGWKPHPKLINFGGASNYGVTRIVTNYKNDLDPLIVRYVKSTTIQRGNRSERENRHITKEKQNWSYVQSGGTEINS